jgi:Rad3-related DNA helicase/DNA polymerase III epsilon subunit-like protein
MRTFVAIDLETTGLDPERDRITEVAAVRFDQRGAILDTFQSLVNPGRDIPYFIEQLTGVTNVAVLEAPRLVDIAGSLRSFVADGPIVGQNVGFDLSYLRREGVPFELAAIDTANLSRLLMPGKQPRGLLELATSLGVDAGEHHRALPDALTAAGVFCALLRRLEEIPPAQRAQLARLVSMHDLTLARLIADEEWSNTAAAAERMLPAIKSGAVYPQLTRREPRELVPATQVAAAFTAAAGVVDRFEERQEQVEMAEAVRRGMVDGGHWLIEAGTGVGKSLAYLIPAALHALRNGERVIISTNTINLQEQLLSKDIPALRRILRKSGVIDAEDDLRASLLKGRANYLCLQRWVANYASGIGDPDFARLAASMLLWLPETATGDRSELNLDSTDWLTWQRFSAQDTDCLSRQNSWVREGNCFLLRARKAAESAHLLIVNHALLLADIATGGSALPPYDHLIIDEAHNLEDQATQQFGGTVSRRRIMDALDGIHRRPARDQREGGVVAILKSFPEGGATMVGRALEDAVARASGLLPACFDALAQLVPPRGEDERLLVTRSVRTRQEWTGVEQSWDTLDRALRNVNEKAGIAVQVVRDTAPIEEPDALAGEIESAARKLEDLRLLQATLMGNPDDHVIVWVGRERDGSGSLNSAPLNVGPTLWEHLFSKKRTVIATSATLSAAGSMEYAEHRLGLERPEKLQLGSPFDYRSSTLLAAFTDVPEPNHPDYSDALAEAIVELVRASDGRALALFTSHASLKRVSGLARGPLEDSGIVVLAQGIDGPPRQLTENLIDNPKTVVFGTSSFWEGVDIRGDALSMLIIARLPFAVPSDPIYRARSEQYDNPFNQYALPGAILRFRQGFGRLIRDREDRGVVAVLDRRIYDKQYGPQFISALPECTRIRGDSHDVAQHAREWLQR